MNGFVKLILALAGLISLCLTAIVGLTLWKIRQAEKELNMKRTEAARVARKKNAAERREMEDATYKVEDTTINETANEEII